MVLPGALAVTDAPVSLQLLQDGIPVGKPRGGLQEKTTAGQHNWNYGIYYR